VDAAMSTKRGGFHNLTPEERQAVSRKGGKAVQRKGNGHKWNEKTAAAAGSKGGTESARRRKAAQS
jgi:general stress protein YciG